MNAKNLFIFVLASFVGFTGGQDDDSGGPDLASESELQQVKSELNNELQQQKREMPAEGEGNAKDIASEQIVQDSRMRMREEVAPVPSGIELLSHT